MKKIYTLVKLYDEPEYVDDLRSGYLFMRKLKEFSKMEETAVKRGDSLEGICTYLQSDLAYIIIGDHKVEGLIGAITGSLTKTEEAFVFSMYASHNGNYTTFTDNEIDEFHESLHINKDAMALGSEMLLITNVEEFLKRVWKAFEKENICCRRGLVRYFEPSTTHKNIPKGEEGFWKRNEFECQNEYRFIANIPSVNATERFFIGDISDISMVTTPEYFNSNMQITLGNKITNIQ